MTKKILTIKKYFEKNIYNNSYYYCMSNFKKLPQRIKKNSTL